VPSNDPEPSVFSSVAADPWRKARAYGVHAFTASGVAFAFLAVRELMKDAPSPRWAFGWLAVAVLIDAADGPLARRWDVKTYAARIGGRTIDDIVDYLTFTFIPLLLVWRMGWLPGDEDALWVVPAMVVSLFGFANTEAKLDEEGFFLGFPSYWNIVAFYVGWLVMAYGAAGAWLSGAALAIFTVLTLTPVRFLYPNRAPRPWRGPIVAGALVWLALMAAALPWYPSLPPWGVGWLLPVSLVYPAFYFGLSLWLGHGPAAPRTR
jgi:phosphatidylcholine synthase